MSAEIAPSLYRELIRIAAHPSWEPRQQVMALSALQERLFVEATRREQLAFSTLFARISYAGHIYHFPEETLQVVHSFRRLAGRVLAGSSARPRDVRLGIKAIAESVLVLYQTAIPAEVLARFPSADEWSFAPPEDWDFKAVARIIAVQDLPEQNALLAVDEDDPARPVRVLYGLPDRNDNFLPTIRLLRQVFGFPVAIHLHDVDIDKEGNYRPRVFVVEPDYLADVSAVAECFKEHGAEPLYYLVKKFLPYETSAPILLGNIANFFLDRLLNEPDLPFPELFRETFQLYPFVYAPMTDHEVREISQKAQKHYVHLRQMAAGGLARQGIDPAHSVLEPTFYSERYGLQGRLDLFYRKADQSAIVELKSGRPFKANSYGIQRSHFTQTLLYDLLVRSVYGAGTDPAKYILYSGVDLDQLRFAPTVAPEQWEALQVRNHLVGIERMLAGVPTHAENVPLLERLTSRNGMGKGFLQRDFALFESVYTALRPVERAYFNAFTGFIARENMLARIGASDSETQHGNAALWRNSFVEKQQAFAILNHLEILENQADQADPTIVFRKTEQTNPLANFRVGDIAVLYPVLSDKDTVLDHQVIKCTITALEASRVVVQLRYRQFNLYPFETSSVWHLEPDMLDTGFVGMYRSLFEWARAPKALRERVLYPLPGERPVEPTAPPIPPRILAGGTAEQAELFGKIIRSPHFFLLWGPPGTGKTSVMLRMLADWVLRETEDNLLLLAYTNRAVDEICDALESLGGAIGDQYLRIGSRFSTAPRYRGQLLQHRISGLTSRAELRDALERRRIFVGTVASFAQNDALLRIKKFQRLVIDEASQLLEPQLAGLLTRFEHFVLIGDHRQLPAVTLQPESSTRVSHPALHAIGLHDVRESYFGRLYRRCVEQGWDWSYGLLSHQGRMHAAIMEFPNRYFYNGLLKILPEDIPAHAAQIAPTNYRIPPDCPQTEAMLALNRVLFLPAPPEDTVPGQKTSRAEAEMVVRIVHFFKKLYEWNGWTWQEHQTLGVITPWRAQIAQIRECLQGAGIDPDTISIDTVERYQGGARDIILLSCCVHSDVQLAGMISLSEEGVDRRLNVALTRARRHVIVLGNKDVLLRDERYRAFIEAYESAERFE